MWIASALLGGALSGSFCSAADRSWSNLAGGTYNTSANWVNGLVAGVNDAACFNNSSVFSPPGQASYSINFAANQQVQAVKVRNDFVTFNLGGRTFTTTAITGNEIGTVGGSGSIIVAKNARLTISGGTLNFNSVLPAQMLVGAVPGGIGSLTVTNFATLTGSPRLFVGTASATGFFDLPLNGGTATTGVLDLGSGTNGRGTATITGPFSQLTTGSLIIGNLGVGTLLIDLAGTVQGNGTATIGNTATGAGSVSIQSTGRLLQNGTLAIGGSGTGIVNLTNGGQLQVTHGVLGLGTFSTGTMNINGSSSSAVFTTLKVGEDGAGSIGISGGGRLTCTSTSLAADRGAGRLTVDGTGSLFESGSLTVGRGFFFSSTGLMNILNGGRVQTAEATVARGCAGTVNVNGAGSSWVNSGYLQVGDGAFGTMIISDGGDVHTGSGAIGSGFGSGGFVIVDGAGSTWTNTGSLIVANAATSGAELSVTNGARVQSAGGVIGLVDYVTGRVTIDGPGSQWINTGSLTVGDQGRGSLTITAGGLVQGSSGFVGARTDDREFNGGTVIISGAGSAWVNSGSLTVGGGASTTSFGILTVESGGRLQNFDGFIGRTLSSTGAVNVQAGTWNNSGGLFVGGDRFVSGGAATLTIGADGVVNAGSLTVWNQDVVELAGGELNIGTLISNASTIGFQSGTLRFTGNANLDDPINPILDRVLGAGHVLGPNRLFSVVGAATMQSLLALDGGAFFAGGGINNNGQIRFDDPGSQVDGGLLVNTGTIRGSGLITNPVQNNPAGQIIVDGSTSGRFEGNVANNGEIRVVTSVVFAGDVTGTGSITGGGGKVFETGSSSIVGNLDTAGSTTVQPGATLQANRIRESSLTVGGSVNLNPGGTNASTSRLNTLSIGNGRLDLADNSLVIDYMGASPFAQMSNMINTGFAGGSWNGVGINSSVAATTPNHAIGIVEATDIGSPTTFGGIAIDSTSLLIGLTLAGDANLDRAVNISDFSLLAANFNQSGRWSRGDFNYDGTVNINDFAALAANFNQSLSADLPRATVPEPAMISAIAILTAMRRGIRKKSLKPQMDTDEQG